MRWVGLTPLELVLQLLSFGAIKPAPEPELDTIDGGPPPEQEAPDAILAPLAVGSDGWLRGDGIVVIRCPKPGYYWRTDDGDPGGLLWHWTATGPDTARAMVKRRAKKTWPKGTVHFWIDTDGTIYQSCSTKVGHGHAGGASSARLRQVDGRVVFDPASPFSANYVLLGCEVINVGEVREVGGRWMGYPFGRGGKTGPIVPAEQVIAATARDGKRRHYQAFTAAQEEAAERLVLALVDRFGFDRAAFEWGHVDVDPKRKTDPGPVWQERILPAILDRVFGAAA